MNWYPEAEAFLSPTKAQKRKRRPASVALAFERILPLLKGDWLPESEGMLKEVRSWVGKARPLTELVAEIGRAHVGTPVTL